MHSDIGIYTVHKGRHMGDWVLGWSDFEEKSLGTRQAVQSLKTN